MAVHDFDDLMNHVGHELECSTYGDGAYTANVAIECINCMEVLLDFDNSEEVG